MAPLNGEPKGIDRRAKPSAEQLATDRRRRELQRRCKYFLPNHGPDSFTDEITRLAEYSRAHPETEPDRYGSGDFLENFEREVAALLGKEAALFFVSGTMAQQIALRIWCERAGSSRIALPGK